MALLFADGFDHMGTGNPVTLGKWGASGGFSLSTTPTRTGTGSLQGNSATDITTKVYVTSGGCIAGIAIQNVAGTFSTTDNIYRVLEGGTTHMALGVVTGNVLGVYRGATLLASGTTVLVANSWYYVEFKCVIHDTNGSYETRIDGVVEAALTNAGPVDTRNGGTGIWDRLMIRSFTTSTTSRYDDFYLLDTSGPAPRNNFLGPIKIETLYPQTDAVAAGSNAGLTPSTGTDHGALVDEPSPNTTDYNSSAVVGIKDTYNYPPMTLTGTIYGIQTNLYVSKSDAVARSVCAVVRSGGVDSDGVNVNPTTTFQYNSEIRPVNTNGGAEWTTAAIAAIEAGMKVTV